MVPSRRRRGTGLYGLTFKGRPYNSRLVLLNRTWSSSSVRAVHAIGSEVAGGPFLTARPSDFWPLSEAGGNARLPAVRPLVALNDRLLRQAKAAPSQLRPLPLRMLAISRGRYLTGGRRRFQNLFDAWLRNDLRVKAARLEVEFSRKEVLYHEESENLVLTQILNARWFV